MTPQTFIEKAIEGGWIAGEQYVIRYYPELAYHQILLDPLAWQAVGKVEGWKPRTHYGFRGCREIRMECVMDGWYYQMHRMIDALAKGKTIEEFLKTL